jgi:hypothetical protein
MYKTVPTKRIADMPALSKGPVRTNVFKTNQGYAQCYKQERKVGVEGFIFGQLNMFADEVCEGGRRENKNHHPMHKISPILRHKKQSSAHICSNPGKNNIRSAVPVVVGLLCSCISTLLLHGSLHLECTARSDP